MNQYGWFDVTDGGGTTVTITCTGYSNDNTGGTSADTSRLSMTRTLGVTTRVIKTHGTSWDVRSRVAKTSATSWDTRARVAKTAATSWDVASELTRVTKTHAASWDTRSRVIKSHTPTGTSRRA